jgi:hypothetical protein
VDRLTRPDVARRWIQHTRSISAGTRTPLNSSRGRILEEAAHLSPKCYRANSGGKKTHERSALARTSRRRSNHCGSGLLIGAPAQRMLQLTDQRVGRKRVRQRRAVACAAASGDVRGREPQARA